MKRLILNLSLILSVLLCSSAVNSAVVKVMLRSESEIQSSRNVAVRDIARVEGPKEAAQKAGDVNIAISPAPGQRRTIYSNYIKARLNSTKLGMGVTVVGPNTISVVGKCVKITPQQLTDEATNFVLGLLPKDNNRTYDVSVQRSPREVIAASGDNVRINPRLYSNSIHPGVNTVALDVEVDGKIVANTSLVIQIKTTADVLVATDTIQTGQPLNAQNTMRERRDISRATDPLPVDSSNANIDWIAGRVISSGSTIRSSDVKLPSDICKGDSVSLVVKCGKVTLHTSAEARQDGRIGDTIRVLTAVSKEDVKAKVMGPGMVEIKR